MAGLDGDDTSSTVYINNLNPLNPDGDDPKSQGDNHARFIKRVLKNTFPNVTGPVTPTAAELNLLDGATLTTAELNLLNGATLTTTELNLLDGKEGLGYTLKSITTYTTGSGTYTVPSGVKALYVECYGGGGGGGGVDGQGTGKAAISGGGGSGAYCGKLITGTLESSYSYAVGAGGAGGAAGANNGTTGDTTTFSGGAISLSAGGGGGGIGVVASTFTGGNGGAGGAASGGDVNITGNYAGYCVTSDASFIAVFPGAAAPGPHGGSNTYTNILNATGVSATTTGSGGGHARVDQTTTNNYAGGDGGAGMIRITEYY